MIKTADHPARALIRYMAIPHLKVFAGFWAIMAVAGLVAAIVAGAFADVRVSAWQLVSQAAPMYFLLVIGILAASIGLPIYVAHGITRCHVSVAAAAFYLPTAVVFGLLTLAGYGIEFAAYAVTGPSVRLTDPYPVASVLDAVSIVTETALLCGAWTCAGWLIGAGFYRFGVWLGILFIPVASIPAVASEIAYATAESIAPGIGMLALIVGLVAAYLLVRSVPIRPVSG